MNCPSLISAVGDLLQTARIGAATAVNRHHTLRNWLFGSYIVDYEQKPPVGLILCTDKKETRVNYDTAGLDQQLFVSRYLVALPKPEELQALIENDCALWQQKHPQS